LCIFAIFPYLLDAAKDKKELRERFLKRFYAKDRPEILFSCEKGRTISDEVLIGFLLQRRRLKRRSENL
jgi:hypothetical protein